MSKRITKADAKRIADRYARQVEREMAAHVKALQRQGNQFQLDAAAADARRYPSVTQDPRVLKMLRLIDNSKRAALQSYEAQHKRREAHYWDVMRNDIKLQLQAGVTVGAASAAAAGTGYALAGGVGAIAAPNVLLQYALSVLEREGNATKRKHMALIERYYENQKKIVLRDAKRDFDRQMGR